MTEKEQSHRSEASGDSELESSLVDSGSNQVEEIIEELEKRPREEKKELIQQLIKIERSHYSGPIPPPELLKGYEDVLPGAADRILVMAEKQSDHRRSMEKTVVESGARDSKLGIICGTIVCLVVMIVGLILSLVTDTAVIGAFLSISGLASLVGTFIYGTKSNSNERKQKSSNTESTPKDKVKKAKSKDPSES